MANSSLAVTGGNVNTWTASNGDHRQGMVIEDAATDNAAAVNAAGEQLVALRAGVLGVTATASGAAVTLTLPAVASQFHYITAIAIELATGTTARAAATAPVTVTTTNLPGAPVWSFASAGAVGTIDRIWENQGFPLRSSVVNTATTFVCPSVTNGVWRLRVFYFTAA